MNWDKFGRVKVLSTSNSVKLSGLQQVFLIATTVRYLIDVQSDMLTGTVVSGGVMYKLADMLALAGRPDEAQRWQRVLCKVNHPEPCRSMREKWIEESKKYPPMAAIPWAD